VYDPVIGRFLSADPFIQEPDNLQSFNRYSYVLNNPLSLTDPSGYFFKKIFKAIGKAVQSAINFVKENWKPIVATIAGLALGAVTMGIGTAIFGAAAVGFGTLGGAILSGAGFGFGSSFAGSLLSGRSIGDSLLAGLKGGVIGGVTAGLTFGVGSIGISGAAGFAVKTVAHGVVQGFATMAQGGRFEHGFLAGMMGKIGGHFGLVGSIVAAGTISEISGGKFMNGAVSGAFVYLFNEGFHKLADVQAYYQKKGLATLPHNSSYGVYCNQGAGCSRGRNHNGVDVRGNIGDNIPSLTSGTVTTGSGSGFGNYVIVTDEKNQALLYAHLDTVVKNVTKVSVGDSLGTMGRTDIPENMPTHVHIQYGPKRDDSHPDPTKLIFGGS
jgi:hypothetical protein